MAQIIIRRDFMIDASVTQGAEGLHFSASCAESMSMYAAYV